MNVKKLFCRILLNEIFQQYAPFRVLGLVAVKLRPQPWGNEQLPPFRFSCGAVPVAQGR